VGQAIKGWGFEEGVTIDSKAVESVLVRLDEQDIGLCHWSLRVAVWSLAPSLVQGGGNVKQGNRI
jgi:hypothetical protein